MFYKREGVSLHLHVSACVPLSPLLATLLLSRDPHVTFSKLLTSKIKSKFDISHTISLHLTDLFLTSSAIVLNSCLSDDKIDILAFLSFFLWLKEKNDFIYFRIFLPSQKLYNISSFLFILIIYCITLQKQNSGLILF